MNAEPSLVDWAGEAYSDRAEWIEAEAHKLFQIYLNSQQAYQMLDDAFGESAEAYHSVLKALACLIACPEPQRAMVTAGLLETLEAALRPELVRIATERYDNYGDGT